MDEVKRFLEEVAANVDGLKKDTDVQALSRIWVREIARHKYAYNFTWMGRPLIQFPQDMVAMQEIIWNTRPDLIIETGVAHGGSLIYYASLLELIGEDGFVLGIDIDVRIHNRIEIEKHPMAKRIRLFQGSSIDTNAVTEARNLASNSRRVMVILDSNHTHDHVLAELKLYGPLVSVGCYLIVFDTLIEDMPADLILNRPWGPGNNPKTAVWEYLKYHPEFVIDRDFEAKLLITVAPDGYLKRIG